MTFRVIVVGVGNRGKMWVQASLEQGETEVLAVVDPSEAARGVFAGRWPGIPAYSSMDEALDAHSCDAVILVTPPDGHLEQARAIFARGLPLLAEKPLTLDLPEAIEIVRLAEQAKLPLSISLNFRFLPVHIELKRLIETKAVGEAGFGHFTYIRNRDGHRPGLNKYPLTMQHPMMLEQTIHHFDLMRFCYGREAVSISCRTWNPPWSHYAHDSNVQALLQFEGGLEVNYFGTWQSGWNEPAFSWRTDCDRGVLIQKQLFSDLFIASTIDTELKPVPIERRTEFIGDSSALLTEFIACVRRGGAHAPCSGRDHLRTLALCLAGLEGAETGKTVKLADFHARNRLGDAL